MAKKEALLPYVNVDEFLHGKGLSPERKAGFKASLGGKTMFRLADLEKRLAEYLKN